jgi:hypothetical protein
MLSLGFQERLSPTVACINTAICYSFATFFAPAKVLVEIPSAGLMRGSNINSTPKAVELKEFCPLASASRIQDQTTWLNSGDQKKHLATPGEVHSSRGPRGNLKLHHEELKSFAELAGVPQSKVVP